MFCAQCGAPMGFEEACAKCQWRPDSMARSPAQEDPSLAYLIPVNRTFLAVLAGYVGLISPLFFPAPFALVLGILALRQINRNPKLLGKGRAIFAIVMGAIFTALIAVAIVLAAVVG